MVSTGPPRRAWQSAAISALLQGHLEQALALALSTSTTYSEGECSCLSTDARRRRRTTRELNVTRAVENKHSNNIGARLTVRVSG
jgi:hypothetical protein